MAIFASRRPRAIVVLPRLALDTPPQAAAARNPHAMREVVPKVAPLHGNELPS